MTEDQQPVWVESDGVSNLPTEVGAYRVRPIRDKLGKWTWFAWFDGKKFGAASSMSVDAAKEYMKYRHDFGDDNGTDAWWDYQGLMAKPLTVISCTNGSLKACEKVMIHGGMVTTVKVSPEKWMILKEDELASDAVGIHKMAERNKPASEPEKVVVGGLTIDMADLVEFLKAKQSKPEPNTTPRGILTMWNEGADHRLGMWRVME